MTKTTVVSNNKVGGHKAAAPAVSKFSPVLKTPTNKDNYPKARFGDGLKGYSLQPAYDMRQDGWFDSVSYDDSKQEIISAIIRSTAGNILSVMIGCIDMNTSRWKWGKNLSRDLINMVDNNDTFEAVQLKSSGDIISLDLYNQKTGASVTCNYNRHTGVEIVSVN
jgi:hypothetical protein